MAELILCFLDLETTGHDPLKLVTLPGEEKTLKPWHEIIDIGCVFAQSDTLEQVGEFKILVKPEYPKRCIPNIINHYRERAERGEWQNAVNLDEAIRQLLDTCQTYGNEEIVCPGGQNWFFDWSFLFVAFTWCGIEEDEWKQYLGYKKFDTASMAMQELKNPGTSLNMSEFSLRSGKLQATLGIKPEPVPHRAINGARQALEVYRKLENLKRKRLSTH